MEIAIADGLAVTLHYRLTSSDGSTVDESPDGDPLVYVHGTGALVPGLERELGGKRAGDQCRIVVEPADAYGLRDPSGDVAVPRSQFPPGVDLEPGMSFQAEGPDGPAQVWITRVGDDAVTISTDHPLAGERLTFDVRVLEVREATDEERNPPDT